MRYRDDDAAGTDSLGDDELVALEEKLRAEYFRVERDVTPPGETRPPSMSDSPELLKAFDKWNRVNTAAKRRGLGAGHEGHHEGIR